MQPPLSVALCGAGALIVACQTSEVTPDTSSERVQTLSAGADTDGDPAVVAIVSAADPTDLRCTGTLISERVALTAAHCGVQYDVSAFAILFGSEVGAAGNMVGLVDAVAHPEFDDTESADLALLLLAQPAVAAAIELLGDPLVADPPPVPLRLVGFGATGADAQDSGRKREGSTQTTEAFDQHVVLGASPSLPCTGDSGGPALLAVESQEKLAAVISRGDSDCASYSKATRVDVHLASFIQPYVDATAPGSAAIGDDCLYDEHCASGICVYAEDEPLLRFCSQACSGAGDCPDPLLCRESQCRFPIPSPGAIGAACSGHDDCLRGECLDDGWCSIRCVSGRGDCPDGYDCTHLGSVDFFCTPPPPAGGCAAAGSPTCMVPSSALLLFAVFLSLVARRRRDDARGAR